MHHGTPAPDAALFAFLPCCFVIGALAISALLTAFWIWMMIDCASNEPSEGNDKVVWILVVVLTGFIGALIYYFVRRPERRRRFGR